MNKFNWAKSIVFGALTWVSMFIIASILVGFGITMSIGWSFVLALAVAVIAYAFATNVEAANSSQALGYGFTWAVIGILLDSIITSNYQSHIFGMWTYWVGYALVLLAPWVEYEIQGSGSHVSVV